MAAPLVAAIHVFLSVTDKKVMDTRVKPAYDD